jgi:hypothetical protein
MSMKIRREALLPDLHCAILLPDFAPAITEKAGGKR